MFLVKKQKKSTEQTESFTITIRKKITHIQLILVKENAFI